VAAVRAVGYRIGRVRRPPRFLAVLLAGSLLAGAALAGCTSAGHRGGSPRWSQPAPSASGDPAARAAAIVAGLRDEDLVGQVLMPYAYGSDANTVASDAAAANRKYAGVNTPAEMIAKYRLGGLILVAWSAGDPTARTNQTTNLVSPAQVHALTAGLQAAAGKLPAGVPLLIGTDQEYGVVTRLRQGVTQLPSAMALGAARNPQLTENAWRAAAADLAAIGVNIDFAPDADVLGPAGSGVIGSRSYGSDPAQVATQVAAAVRGMQAAGLAATLKHFPGHGHTTADSHTNLPALIQSRQALESDDLPPFAAGIQAGAQAVMSGHLDVRSIDAGTPASLSSKVLIDLLRTRLGFTGVVVTDALNMAPVERFGPGEAAIRALLAGNDLLLMPPDPAAAQQALLGALHTGRVPKARLIEAVTRIVTLKLRVGAAPRPDMSTVDSQEHRAAAGRAAAAAVTVLRGTCAGALVTGPVTITSSGGRDQQRAWLAEALAAHGVKVAAAGGAVVHLLGYGDTAADVSAAAAVTVAMDTPYVLRNARSSTLIATYSSTQGSMSALAAVLAGKSRAPGRSPVTVPGLPASAC
jgi:beta-N-acetylhexosaminidase